jgi:ubiquinone/menaquinone biosynthesis C-methylase UbiE
LKTKHKKPDFELYAETHGMHGNIPNFRSHLLDKYLKPSMKILDLGCGDGQHLEYLAQRLPKNNLFATEISQIRVNRVRKKGFNCKKVDGVELPFDSNFFDAIIFFEVIEHIPEKEVGLLLKEFHRVLKPKGLVIGSTPNYPVKLFYMYFLKSLKIIKVTFKKIFMTDKNKQKGSQLKNGINKNELYCIANNKNYFNKIKYKIMNIFNDDPTHLFFCNFNIINELGSKLYKKVELHTTFFGKSKPININNPKKYLSKKITFVFWKS